MSGEIVKAEEAGMLEEIAAELGSNLAIEKAVIQDGIVFSDIYETAMKSSNLLLKLSKEMSAALAGNTFSKNLHVPNSLKSILKVNKAGKVTITTLYADSNYSDSRIQIYPNSNKINIKIKDDHSLLKRIAIASSSPGITIPVALISGAFIPAFAVCAALLVPSGALLITEDDTWLTHNIYKDERLFKDINKALGKKFTREKIDNFIDYYFSLPGIVYNAVEEWISRNKSTVTNMQKKSAEYRLLEEKLR